MNQAGAMLGQTADNGLVDRMLIEIQLQPGIERQLRRIEATVNWTRDRWHPKIGEFLTKRDEERGSARVERDVLLS
jgi:hypothetical protein